MVPATLVVAVGFLTLGQAPPASRAATPRVPDAGSRTTNSSDATDVTEARLRLAEEIAAAARAKAEDLERELTALRARTVQLEASKAQADAQSGDVSKKLDTLNNSVLSIQRSMVEAADRRDASGRDAVDARAQYSEAIGAVGGVDRALERGSTDGLEFVLQQAEASFRGQAANYLQAARNSLAQGDLANVRYYLKQAIDAAQRQTP